MKIKTNAGSILHEYWPVLLFNPVMVVVLLFIHCWERLKKARED